MLLDAALPPVPLENVPEIARAAEEIGFNALWSTETIHDPFLPGALIAEHTRRLGFGTAIAVSFARSPATLAYTAWDLAQASQGRFILGLGTQVKAHIERRFGMPWPASVTGKLGNQIQAIRAFWRCWQTGEPFKFTSEYYRLSLMSPFFNPGPIQHPEIPIYIAGVNCGLAKLAGAEADGFMVHPFHSPAYLIEALLPAIRSGVDKSGRSLSKFSVSATAFVVTSPEEENLVRAQIAFYASTPSYRTVLAHHGWEQTGERLSALARRGRWAEMPSLVSDEMLEAFAVFSTESELAGALEARYQGLTQRLSLYLPFTPGQRDGFWRGLVNAFSAEQVDKDRLIKG